MKLILSFLGAMSLFGSDYYVSANGSDRQSGSITDPWGTVERVNQMCFAPGDRVYFQGGQVFSGRVRLNALCQFEGSQSAPITVGSYGSGRAVITGGFEAYDKGGIVLRNLIFRHPTTANTADGVAFHITRRDGVHRRFLRLEYVEVSGFGGFGVMLGSWYPESGGYLDARLFQVVSFNNRKGGIVTWGAGGAARYTHKQIYVGYSAAYNISGYRLANFPAGWKPQGTGNGILLGSVDGGTIEYSTAFNNGAQNDYIDGPVGIMVYDSRNILIQQCTAYNNKTLSRDGNGFALDRNTSNSILQNNWSWNNDGVGLYLAQNVNQPYHFNNIVRYNSSRNDGRRGSFAGLSLWGPMRDVQIYGNEVVMGASATGKPRAVAMSNALLGGTYMHNVAFQNNSFTTIDNVPMLSVDASLLSGSTGIVFRNNLYSATYLTILWGSNTYASLDAWKAASQQEAK